MWNNLTGEATVTLEHSSVVRCVDISGDGRYVLTGGYEKKVRVYDLRTDAKTQPIRVLEGCQNDNKTALLDSDNGYGSVCLHLICRC